tara:strand:+ start:2181 stop:2567 length:387 start_codon:yes stop_codon:yes gene_type:complete
MKITKQQLKRIIEEEISNVLMEDEAVVPPPKVQAIINDNKWVNVKISKIVDGRIWEYEVSNTGAPEQWGKFGPTADKVAAEIANIGVQTGHGPDSVLCEDPIQNEMGLTLTGKCKVQIDTHAGNVGNY